MSWRDDSWLLKAKCQCPSKLLLMSLLLLLSEPDAGSSLSPGLLLSERWLALSTGLQAAALLVPAKI